MPTSWHLFFLICVVSWVVLRVVEFSRATQLVPFPPLAPRSLNPKCTCSSQQCGALHLPLMCLGLVSPGLCQLCLCAPGGGVSVVYSDRVYLPQSRETAATATSRPARGRRLW